MKINVLANGGYIKGGFSSTGGELSGYLLLHADPIDNLHPATKRYVDETVVSHENNTQIHLTESEKTFLTGLTVSSTDVNKLLTLEQDIQDKLDLKENSLNFTPIQQGGVANQLSNKVYIGWTGTQLGLQVDNENYSGTWPINITGTASAISWTKVTSKPNTLDGYGIIDAAPSTHIGSGSDSHAVATTTTHGFLSFSDKIKLDSIADSANNYVHPTSGVTAGTYKSVTVNAEGHITAGTNPTTLAEYGITDAAPSTHVGSTGNAHGLVSGSVSGFMSSSDKTKLDGIALNANNYVHPTSGVAADTYTKVTVNTQGHVTAGASLAAADIPSLDASKITSGALADARLPTRLGATAASISDWNTAISNGWYMASNADNSPEASVWFIGHVENHGAVGWCTQTVHAFSGDSESDTKTYRREQNNGAWGSWYRLRLSEVEQRDAIINTGTIVRTANGVAPVGYIKCDGGTYSPTTQSRLYNAIGYKYGRYNAASLNYISVALGYTSYSTFGHGKYWENQYDFSSSAFEPNNIEYYKDLLPVNLHLSGVVVTNSRVYILGGYNGTSVVNTIYTAVINNDGTLGSFTSSGTLPVALCDMQVVVTENLCVIIGGYNGTTEVNTTYTASIAANGTLGSFTASVTLPAARGGHQAFVTKNKLYVVGGWSGSAATNTVYVSTISATGTLGAFSTGTALPISVANHRLIATRNKVFLVGGYNGTSWLNTVYSATIDSAGSIGTWTAGTALPMTIGDAMSMVIGNKAYLIGGFVNGNTSNRIYVSDIDTSGNLGTFRMTGTDLPESMSNGNLFITKDNIYIAGYWDSFKTTNRIVRLELDDVGLVNYDVLFNGAINKFDGTNLSGTVTAGTAPSGEVLFRVPNYTNMDAADNLTSYIKA